MRLLKFKNGLYEKYKKTVKGNDKITYKDACRKMTRNMLLAKKVELEANRVMYQYGSLHFIVHDDRIIWIRNYQQIDPTWRLIKADYIRLTKYLEIDENVTMLGLYIKEYKGKLKYWKNKIKWKIINFTKK